MRMEHMAQFFATFLLPVPLVIIGLLIGLLLLRLDHRRSGTAIVAGSALLLALFAWPPFGAWLVGPLERQYTPITDPAALAALTRPERVGPVRVLVLGAGHWPSAERPLSSELSATAIARLAEGVRLHRALPGSRLVTSGAGEPPSMAATAAALARSWGIEAVDIHPTPANTAQEARVAAERFGDAPLVLVTSASHMPRAMALFRARGLDPVPAPTHYLHPPPEADLWRVRAQRPSATGLRMSERAIYEYLGLAWAQLRGTI
ncbi:MAG: ElyC/SanA/YdcF family protein [Pseudomonadota bacterium]